MDSLKWYEKARGMKKPLEKKEKHASRKEGKNLSSGKGKDKISDEKKTPAKKEYQTVKRTSSKSETSVKSLDSLLNFASLPEDCRKVLENFDTIIENCKSLSSKHKALLPKQIKDLSHFLTDERSERRLGYMNETTTLSSYIYYYAWWNLVRLTRLFANLPSDFFKFDEKGIALDLGSGPLTLVISLFIARPELRNKDITFYCMDLSSKALSRGEEIFLSVAAFLKCEPWKIVRIQGNAGEAIKEKADLVCAANVFNEISQGTNLPPDYLAKKYTDMLSSYAKKDAEIIVVEPGVPSAARLVSLMRDSFIRKNFLPSSPCLHCSSCPMDGKKGGKWCNFAFNTENAPKKLRKLSEASGLPKERAVLTFIACKRKEDSENSKDEEKALQEIKFRIASDPIRLAGKRQGFYACSSIGLLLIETDDALHSGEAYSVLTEKKDFPLDSKSGAKIVKL